VQGNMEELRKIMGKFKTAMLVTSASDGKLRGRPMAIQQREDDQSIWLATSDQSDKVQDVAANPVCAVLCHDGERSPTYVSMSGDATIVRDAAKIRELWDPAWRLWFPEGPDEKDIVLLHFTPSHVEYADPAGGKAGVILSAMKRLVTKEYPPKGDKSEVDLKG
jgi:general stress protein 26